MSKYFDRLVKMNEEMDNELKARGLVFEQNDEENTIPVPTDSLTDEQKKDILVNDREIDKEVVDGMSPEEMDGALKASDDDGQKNESADGSEEFYIRIDDDDLEIHGYLSRYSDADEPEWVTDENKAQKFKRGECQEVIDTICKVAHYDPHTITTQYVESQIEDSENWISLDSMQPGSTTLG